MDATQNPVLTEKEIDDAKAAAFNAALDAASARLVRALAEETNPFQAIDEALDVMVCWGALHDRGESGFRLRRRLLAALGTA